jgi:hypothetical protein
VIRLFLDYYERQVPTREQRPKLTEGGVAWRQLAQAIAKQERETQRVQGVARVGVLERSEYEPPADW